MPESSNFLRLAAALGIATAVSSGVAACGPSGGGGTPANYAILFTLSDASEELETLNFTVTYSGGEFVGDGTAVDCSRLEDIGDSAVITDHDDNTLTVVITATTNELVKADELVECTFEASSQPTTNNFVISLITFTPTAAMNVAVVTSIEVGSANLLGEETE